MSAIESNSSIKIAIAVALPRPLVEELRGAFPRLVIADATKDDRHLDDAEVALVYSRSGGDGLARASKLRWVQTYGAGVNALLTPALIARRDLVITNARGVHAEPIAEHSFGLILMFARRLHHAVLRQSNAVWDRELTAGLGSLSGKTLGILGVGAIGRQIARIGRAFGMRVVGTKRHPVALAEVDEIHGPEGLPGVLRVSDYLVNVLPSTPETRGILGARELAVLPEGAVLINVGRGDTIDTDALVAALRGGRLRGAGLDVTDPEPLPQQHPLWSLPNAIITPHYAGAQPHYDQKIAALFTDNLRRYVSGQPLVNVVDASAGY